MKTISILYGEDFQPDAVYSMKMLERSSYNVKVKHMTNGLNLMNYLFELTADVGSSLPDLILLDINMPGKSGLEILMEIKSSPSLKDIPVILLTVSKSENHMHLGQRLKAEYYMVKPMDIELFDAIVGQIKKFHPRRYIMSN